MAGTLGAEGEAAEETVRQARDLANGWAPRRVDREWPLFRSLTDFPCESHCSFGSSHQAPRRDTVCHTFGHVSDGCCAIPLAFDDDDDISLNLGNNGNDGSDYCFPHQKRDYSC